MSAIASQVAAKKVYTSKSTNIEHFTVACPGQGCHQNCPLRVEVTDGVITKVDAAPIPDSPEDTHACLRGLASYTLPYIPNRLKYPMRRVGERGEGRWERISWEQAYDTIAGKLSAIRDQYGPEAVLISSSGSSAVPIGGLNAGGATTRFGNLFGCTSIVGWPVDGGLYCAGLVNYGFFFGGGNDPADWINSKLLVIWGENMAESAMRDFNYALRARANGAKIVVIGPTFDATAAKADWWIPVEPRTDGALALSMLHVILDEGLHDPVFVANHTVGPFLVRDDNGQFLRESDLAKSGSPDNYVAWDEAAGKAVPIPPKVSEVAGMRPALMGSFTVNGVASQTAFQLLAKQAAEYAPERATAICKLDPETIRELARAYAAARPAAIKIGHGMARTFYGDLNCRAIFALAAVTGNVGISGGGASGWARSYSPFLNSDPVYAANEKRNRRIHISAGHEAITRQQPFPIKAWLLFAVNPLNAQPNAAVWIEQILPKLDFIVAVDIVDTWTAQYADILLPGTTIYERSDLYTAVGCTVLSQQAIEPQYEAKSDLEICTELAKRLGFGEHFTGSTDEYLEVMLDHPTQQGITLDGLKRNNGIMRPAGPRKSQVAYPDKKFQTPSGKIEFYAEYLKEIGQELPRHLDPPESRNSELGRKFPLQFFTARTRFINQSQSYLPITRELRPEPKLRMNPVDALARGLAEGDLVRVFNDRGEVKVKMILSNGIRPGTVWVEHGWWPKDFAGSHYQNVLKPVCAPDETMINPAFQTFWQMFKEYAENAPSPGLTPYGIADQLFDCMAEVEAA